MASVDYILVASGSIALPRLDICVYATENEPAMQEAEKMVGPLSTAGYTHFWLYYVKDGEQHVHLETFTVETMKPIVRRKNTGQIR